MKTYGYARVSTLLQNTDRQVDELLKFGIPLKDIYIDKVSGKTFDRKNYQKLIKKIKKDDLIVIKSLDRLGRNYEMIISEWKNLTTKMGVNILVLDMPILDTREKGNGLVGKFISDIVLQVLSFVAENERLNISQRTIEGLKIAKNKGKKLGRPIKKLPDNYEKIYKEYIDEKISSIEASHLLGISRVSFFKKIKEYKNKGT